MVVRVASLVTLLGLSSVPMALAQGPSVGDGVETDAVTSVVEASPAIPQLSFEMPPRVVVYPGEEIVLLTDVPHDSGYEPLIPNIPYVEWLEYGEFFVSHWEAYGGRLLSVGEEMLVYKAPTEPGVACLVWNNGVDEPIMLMVIVPGEGESWDQEVELPRESLRGNDGCYLPCAGGTSFRLFAVAPTQAQPGSRAPGAGFAYVPSNKPLNPPPDDLDCSGTGLRAVLRVKPFSLPPETRFGGVFRVTARAAAELARLGISVEVGAEIRYDVVVVVTRKVKNYDFYRCEDGTLVYCGNQTSTWFETRVVATVPPWVCRFLPQCTSVTKSGFELVAKTGCAP